MPLRSVISSVPQWWIVCALCSWALGLLSYKNSCLYMIMKMIDSTSESKRNHSVECPFLYDDGSWERKPLPLELPVFYQNSKTMDIADSVFFFGRLIMLIPAGVLSDLGYSKHILGGGIFLLAVEYVLLFSSADLGVEVYMLEEFLNGISEAFIHPSVYTLVSRWAPPSKRYFYIGLLLMGFPVGQVIGRLLVFKLVFLEFKSWSIGNFISGALVLLWLPLGLIFIYHTPSDSPFVDKPELTSHHKKLAAPQLLARLYMIPWRQMLSSFPFLVLIIAYCSLDWTAYVNIWTSFEAYEKYVLHLPAKSGDESLISVIAGVPSTMLGALLADWVVYHKFLSRTLVIKVFAFISVFISTVLQMSVVLVSCNVILFWILTTAAIYVLGFAAPLISCGPIDLNPRNAGLLTGVMVGAKTIISILRVDIEGIFITEWYSSEQWRLKVVFYSILSLAMVVPFLIFGSGEIQNWKQQFSDDYDSEDYYTSTSEESETV